MFNFRSYFCFKPRGSNLLQEAGTRKRRGVCRWVCRQVAFHHIIHPILTRDNIVKYSEKSKRFGIMLC